MTIFQVGVQSCSKAGSQTHVIKPAATIERVNSMLAMHVRSDDALLRFEGGARNVLQVLKDQCFASDTPTALDFGASPHAVPTSLRRFSSASSRSACSSDTSDGGNTP